MSLENIVSDKTIDLTGLRCPNLLIATIQAMETMERNQVLQIIATDLNAPSNMAAWARQSKHELLDLYDENGTFIILIRNT